MSRSLRRGALAALVLAAIVPLSACAAGNTPDTLQVKPDNASTSIGNNLKLNNIVVVTRADAAGRQSGPANLSVNISNTGSLPERLQSIVADDGSSVKFVDAAGAAIPEVVIPAGGSVLLGGEGQPVARLSSASVIVGGYTPTTFSFTRAGKVTVLAQVVPAKGPYAAFGPAASLVTAAPSALSSVLPSPGASVPPSPGASASPSAGASASPASTASPSAPVSGSPTH